MPAPAADAAGAVEAVQAVLARLPGLPVDEHVAAYDEVHRLLQRELSRLDEG